MRGKLAAGALALALGLCAARPLARAVAPRLALRAPVPTVVVHDAGGRYLADLGRGAARGFWRIEGPLPERVVRTTLAAEDERFDGHPGVDPRAVARAVAQDLRRLSFVEGASTLAMQVARLQSPGPRTIARKAAEALVALELTARHGREAVLRHYLTIAPYGNQCHGAAYAARRYFEKPLCDLTWAEASLLASLPRLPGRMNVHREAGRRRAERRARHVIARMRALGWIPPAEADRALEELPRLTLRPRPRRPADSLHLILALEQEHRAGRLAPAGGLVQVPLDRELQDGAARIARATLAELRADGAGNVAVVVAEKDTGNVRAYVGSADFADATSRGSIDYARARRSPGSTLKPFVYALGLAHAGFTGATILSDVGLVLDAHRGGYAVKNYDGGWLGPIPYRNALANSRNIPAAEVLSAVGVERAYAHLVDLGLARGGEEPKRYGLSLVLGALDVTLVDLVRAYGVLARDGRSLAGRQLLPPEVARQITLFLSDPIARLPSFPRMGWLEYPFPVAVKTGTSSGFRDAWCVAYSQSYVVGAWIGHPAGVPMKKRCGADSAAAVVHKVMALLHPERMRGLSDLAFQPPEGFVSRRIDMLTGRLARDDTPYAMPEWFRPGTEPVALTDAYATVEVDARTGAPAAPGCPPERRQLRKTVALPERYARWARHSGLEPPPAAPREPWKALSADPALRVLAPRADVRLRRDPETPREQSTIALEAAVSPPAPQVVWYVDGRFLCVADYPYTARWQLEPGVHSFQVGLPYAPLKSEKVKVSIAD